MMNVQLYPVEKTTNVLTSPNSVINRVKINNQVKTDLDIQTLKKLVKKSNRILLSISSHAFPFDFFPNTINIEEGRISIINRQFLSSQVHSIDIKDLSNIFINTTLFYSQLVIISKTFEENEVKIRNLWTNEAVYARRIIEGLRVFEQQKIDTSIYSQDELINQLKLLSTTDIVI